MLAVMSLNNETDRVVYAVPTNKKAVVYVDLWAVSANSNVTIKINNVVYFTGNVADKLSLKLALDAGDNIKITTPGQINVFVHGLEM